MPGMPGMSNKLRPDGGFRPPLFVGPVSSDATEAIFIAENASKSPRSMGGALRSVDYRLPGRGRFDRCSVCHHEQAIDNPHIVTTGYTVPSRQQLSYVMLGNELLGFVCSVCHPKMVLHIANMFPDSKGFPMVDKDGFLVPTPRCDCGTALGYTDDGRTVVCPKCDV